MPYLDDDIPLLNVEDEPGKRWSRPAPTLGDLGVASAWGWGGVTLDQMVGGQAGPEAGAAPGGLGVERVKSRVGSDSGLGRASHEPLLCAGSVSGAGRRVSGVCAPRGPAACPQRGQPGAAHRSPAGAAAPLGAVVGCQEPLGDCG